MARTSVSASHRSGTGTVFGVILVILGASFLAEQVLGLSVWATAWPFGIVAVGLAFFVTMLVGGKSFASLAIPGSIISTVGLILAYQDYFSRYETWSYAWALIVVAVGIGLLVKGFWTDDPKAFQAGLRVAGIGAALFVVFGAFFELVIGFSGIQFAWAGQYFWPVLLIVLGIAILLRRGTGRDVR